MFLFLLKSESTYKYLFITMVTLISLLLLMLIVIRVIYFSKDKSSIDQKKLIFQEYISSLQFNHLPEMIISEKLNQDTIRGTSAFIDIPRIKIEINGHTIHKKDDDTNPIEKVQLKNSYKFSSLEHLHKQYVYSLIGSDSDISALDHRIKTAAYLEHIFKEHGQIPQRNLIHELVTYLHQGAYIGQPFILIYDSFIEHIAKHNEHIVHEDSIVSIKVLNNHSIQLNIKQKLNVKTFDSDYNIIDKAKYTINPEISFVMSSVPNNIASPILYSQVQIKFNKPKPLSKYFSTETREHIKNGHKFTVSVKNGINKVILRMSNFKSPPHSAFLQSKGDYKISEYYAQEDAHTYLDSTTCSGSCFSRQKSDTL
ncbi:hypothetical protein IMW64_01255 [Ehrlichia ruminantium]|nr:hypothetical protein FDZ65_01270 [Ehrlichia ruminantium]QLK53981.1 hypothetical protein FDZ63_01265 [Ehrlichia ruminantium]QLK56731.1 hypothetical protein FDZ60_01265 [Ehrlichia ruminantium]UOD98105.1 hypothetical protein IMW64_01255 [Ehrlichia ruminantium]